MAAGRQALELLRAVRCRGQVIVAPGGSKRFTIFNNSTKLAQTAAVSRDPSRLPSFMVTLPFRDFADRLRVRAQQLTQRPTASKMPGALKCCCTMWIARNLYSCRNPSRQIETIAPSSVMKQVSRCLRMQQRIWMLQLSAALTRRRSRTAGQGDCAVAGVRWPAGVVLLPGRAAVAVPGVPGARQAAGVVLAETHPPRSATWLSAQRCGRQALPRADSFANVGSRDWDRKRRYSARDTERQW